MHRYMVVTAAAMAAFFLCGPAMAQMVCGFHQDIKKRLKAGYQEVPVGMGLAGGGGVIELFKSEKGTFSIVLTRPSGMSI